MKKIKLTNGDFSLVDDIDYDKFSKYRWSNCLGYAQHKMRISGKNRKTLRLHRLIMDAPNGYDVDHINHDKLDNRRCNLRIVSGTQNNWNMLPRKGTSKYKGVCWSKQMKKWRATIKYLGKQTHIGLFDKEIDAAIAYDKKATQFFGEFAHINGVVK